jgi:hypothetical protein
MKKLLALLFSLMISFNSYGEWTETSINSFGNTNYMDMERIRQHDGYVYWWYMVDYLKPTELGILSSKIYMQGECGVYRTKFLSYTHSKKPMGEGGESNTPSNPEWEYVQPGSGIEDQLDRVCANVK